MLRISNMVTEILTSEDTVRVVDGLSLTLNRGEICALVGESGCGKSMTAFFSAEDCFRAPDESRAVLLPLTEQKSWVCRKLRCAIFALSRSV